MEDDNERGWYTDTTGRHEKRLWDGAWTDQVMDGGQVSTDVVDAPSTRAVSPARDSAVAIPTPPPWRLRDVYGAVAGAAMTNAWIAPLVAGSATAAVFLGWQPFWLTSPVGIGVVAGLLVWLMAAIVLAPIVATPRSQSHSWDESSMRLAQVRALVAGRLPGDCAGRDGVSEAQAVIDRVDDDFLRPGMRWATHVGYITMWEYVHRAEEAMILSLPEPDLWQALQKMRLRLDGAQGISARLTAAVDDVARFLSLPRPAGGEPAPGQAGTANVPTDLGLPPVGSLPDARGRLREVASGINSFRDDQFAGLVRLRNRTLGALCFTALSAYVLLSLAVSYSSVGKAVVTTAMLFFLVAAIVGFLARLMTLSSADAAVEDYGLSFARLLIVPVLSGLAGLGGVLLTGMLFNTSFSSLLTASAARLNPPALPHPADVFNLASNPAGLLVALVFGWAPTLLQGRLDSLVDSYKTAIKSTEPAQSGSSGAG